ncbi:purine-cytosine permease family protein [Pseudomonas juntendi]|uniref:purine-cytosine permease family protein n=1 Tax=Pseudomonas juntendi TaxID=2666183 RepID=UPI001F443F1E|nr:cytosine permease [Pseudomonas juntendi]MCO7054893.1 cytosine permease [Pseudomonas juntendi]UJM14739.1 cytosine permease [Pseudomonas juntendi]
MKVEKRSIDFIPESERYGKPVSLFYIWFGANMNITTIASGVLPVMLGLNLFWSAMAIILGSLIGAIFMASHSAQGPKLGILQMIQSRAQFGVIGAVLPLLFVMLIYLGFFVSNTLLAAQAIDSVSPLGSTGNIYLIGALCFVVALYGYWLIHRLQKVLSILSILVFLVVTVLALGLPVPDGQWTAAGFSLSKFLAAVSIAVTWQLSYAPYVADYSRYLPSDTPMSRVFWYSYAGTVAGGAWMMVLGAILSVVIAGFSDNVGSHVAELFGVGAVLLFVFIVYGQVAINVFNLYGAFMSTVTVIEPFSRLRVTPRVRGLFMLVITVIATALCTVSQQDFIAFFLNFIFFMSYFLIPWTAINLVDYYCLRKGNYSVPDIFDLNGRYGRFNLVACGSFVLAIVLEIPFMNTTLYVGPVANALDGIDLAWVVGLVVPAMTYYGLMKRKPLVSGESKLSP